MEADGRVILDTVPLTEVSYALVVTARDDGQCCGGQTSNSAYKTITIEVIDDTNSPPEFKNCSSYNPSIEENKPTGTSIQTVCWYFFY